MKTVIMILAAIVSIAVIFYLIKEKSSPFGKLPGDFSVQVGSKKVVVPIVSSLLTSIMIIYFMRAVYLWLG